MTASGNRRIGRPQRRQYLVDGAIQYGIAWRVLLALCGVAALYALGIYLLLGEGNLDARQPSEVRKLILSATAIYFVLGMAIVAIVTLLLTHRVAGPAWVISRALKGMLEGDFERRLNLRESDYLQDVATNLQGVRRKWSQRETEIARELDAIEASCPEACPTELREAVERLRAGALNLTTVLAAASKNEGGDDDGSSGAAKEAPVAELVS